MEVTLVLGSASVALVQNFAPVAWGRTKQQLLSCLVVDEPQLLKLVRPEPVLHKRSHRNEKPTHHN